MATERHWIDEFFVRDSDVYYATYLHRLSPTEPAVDLVVKALDLQSHEHVLDLACGHGRHAIELARRGFENIAGLDYSPVFLEKAAYDASAAGVSVRWIHADMRTLSFGAEFDAIYSLFTSLFFFDDETNQRVLNGIGRALRPAGRFLVQTVNALQAIRREPRRESWEALPQGGWRLDRWRYEPRTGRDVAERHLLMPDGSHVLQEVFVRDYTVPELERMAGMAGLRLMGVYGDTDWGTITWAPLG